MEEKPYMVFEKKMAAIGATERQLVTVRIPLADNNDLVELVGG
jgi:hypothetical protein